MSERTPEAELALANPDEELAEVLGEIKELSATNQSESSVRREFEDGSVLIARCWKGGEVHTHVFASVEEANGTPLPILPECAAEADEA